MAVMTETFLSSLGIHTRGTIYRNLPPAELVEHAIRRGEGELASNGALVVRTGKCTGRSPNAKFIVRDETTEDTVWWGGPNQAFTEEGFERIRKKILEYFRDRDLYVFDGFVIADPELKMPVRIVVEKAWHALFCHTQFRRPEPGELDGHNPEFIVLNAADLLLDPELDGTGGDVGIIISFSKRMVLIAGSAYAGETKKSVFTYLNYVLPDKGVLPMHCSANVGPDGDTALFFGLSGTGKTSLSADPKRKLIGDDEHGWGEKGIFNFEGGCYAKMIRVTPQTEPQIYYAIRFGSVLENVVLDEYRNPDYFDASITENTRGTYPIEHIENAVLSGIGGHPANVFFLAADAFGILPPIAKLTPEQMMYHFISGYTAKVAGTERGVTEPKATFSACFGLPFLPRHPGLYAKMLAEKVKQRKCNVWLVNTGWSGGPFGVGERMPIHLTRTLLNFALNGAAEKVSYEREPVFNLLVPQECPGVPKEILLPRDTWKDKEAYDKKAQELKVLFIKNFEQYKDLVSKEVLDAGPKLDG